MKKQNLKRFKTRQELHAFLNQYDNSDTFSVLMKVGNDLKQWYYADNFTFKPLCYYLSCDKM